MRHGPMGSRGGARARTAMKHYREAFRLDGAGNREKIALLALRIDERKRGELSTETRSPSGSRKRLNPSLACALSMLFPGLGQLYNGEYRKAAGFALLWVLLLPNLYAVFSALLSPLSGHGAKPVSGMTWFIALGAIGVRRRLDRCLALRGCHQPGKDAGEERLGNLSERE